MRHSVARMMELMRIQISRVQVFFRRLLAVARKGVRRSIISYSWWAAVFQAPLVASVICLWLFTPSPGFAVALLAFAAGVMAVRGDHFTKTESVIWILIAGALCFIELRALNEDRAERETQEDARRWQDDFNRQQERRQFAALLEQGSQMFNEQEAATRRMQGLSKASAQAINLMTGGDSFCYVTAITNAGAGDPITFPLIVWVSSYPMRNVASETGPIFDHPTQETMTEQIRETRPLQLGDATGTILGGLHLTRERMGLGKHFVKFTSLNHWLISETIDLTVVNGQVKECVEVTGGKVLHREGCALPDVNNPLFVPRVVPSQGKKVATVRK